MELDSKAIETLSVNAVKNSIVTTDFLDQFIAENDKEPSWDGFVYMYSNKSKKKSNFKGRMPVQVKGKMCDDHDKEIISYSMSTADLKNYLNDGGCILFVVYIGCEDLVTKIYYAELTPIKLRQLLEDADQQDWKSVKLREFPSDNNKKCTIFFNCLQNCQKQASFKDGKLFTLEELEEQGVLENIVIPVSGVGINDPQIALINNEVYAYARIKGSSIPQPLYDIPKEIHTKENIDALITIEVVRLINEQKATMIVDHISYDTIEGEYDSTIFTAEKNTQSFDKAFLAKKAIQDYVFTDGSAEKSIERTFAEDLDAAEEVCVYAKLPRTFQIPTPVGNYSPDWAIAFYEGTVKHIFFVAETKGTMESLELRPIEQAKISCAKKLFNEMSTSKVRYHDVDSYQKLLEIMPLLQ